MTPFGEEWYLDADDGCCRLYIVEQGDGPVVIVLHGGPGHSHGYLADAVRSLTSDFKVVLYDQRGALLSPCDLKNISLDKNVDDLEQLRRELVSDEPVRIIAHSAGTILAMTYVARYPEAAINLTLLGSLWVRGPSVDEFARFDIPLTEASPERKAEVEERVEAQLRIEGLDGEVSGARDLHRKRRIRFAAGNIHDVSRWRQVGGGGSIYYNEAVGIATAKTSPDYWDFTEALKTFGKPVTFINGDEEHLRLNTAFWHSTLRPIPKANLVVLDQAGHAAWIDQPSRFEKELHRAVTKV